MRYVTILWSVVAASSLMLAVVHSLVWILDRRARANLAFAIAALGLVGMAWTELGMMSAQTPDEWGQWVRWFHVPHTAYIVATIAFVRLYLGTGRPWFMWTVIALRGAILAVNFAVHPNFNFQRIDDIVRVPFFGEQVSIVGHAVPGSWQWIATGAAILYLLFIADATVTLWRSGSADHRRKAAVVAGAVLVVGMISIVDSQLVVWGLVRLPTLISPPFLIMLAAMAFELTRDTLRASRLARELSESEERLELAASAAGLGLWAWDRDSNRVWATDGARTMFGWSSTEELDAERIAERIGSKAHLHIRTAVRQAAATGGEYETQFRIDLADGSQRWIAARGRAESDPSGRVTLARGVLRDITRQHEAEEEADELRRELAHAGRVSALGQLSSAIAHELSQPLGSILRNVEAAEMMLQHPAPDLQELRDAVADIHRDDRRATQVIDRLRALLRRRALEFQPIVVDSLIQDVDSLVRSDATRRHVTLEIGSEAGLPAVFGDRVHLSQVLINLIINAMDAVIDLPDARRQVTAKAHNGEAGWVEVVVSDRGTGIPPDAMARVFEPFFTMKPSGMGMGLSVSRTIVEAHGGRIWAENNPDGGATFRFTVPVFDEARA